MATTKTYEVRYQIGLEKTPKHYCSGGFATSKEAKERIKKGCALGGYVHAVYLIKVVTTEKRLK